MILSAEWHKGFQLIENRNLVKYWAMKVSFVLERNSWFLFCFGLVFGIQCCADFAKAVILWQLMQLQNLRVCITDVLLPGSAFIWYFTICNEPSEWESVDSFSQRLKVTGNSLPHKVTLKSTLEQLLIITKNPPLGWKLYSLQFPPALRFLPCPQESPSL